MTDVLVAGLILPGGQNQVSLMYSDNGAGWGSQPGIGQQSGSTPGVAEFNDALWAAFRGNTGTEIYVCPSTTWAHAQTGQSSNVAPAVTVFNNQLWIAYVGEATSHVEVISSSDGTHWSASTSTGRSSNLAPAITVFGGALWIAYVDQATGHIEVISSTSGTDWSPPTATGQASNEAPGITVFQGNQLWIAYIGEATGHVEAISSASGQNWSASASAGQSSSLPPAIAGIGVALNIAYIKAATGHIEIVQSENGTAWSPPIDTGQPSPFAPSLTAVSAVTPPGTLEGEGQYVLAAPQGIDWPTSTAPIPPVPALTVTIHITEELTFSAETPLSFQLNCAAPAGSSFSPGGANWKIGFQQYVLMMQPGSTEFLLHIQNFGPESVLAVYAGNSTQTINFPDSGSIPAGWTFSLALEYQGASVSGATCTVTNAAGGTVGTLSLQSIGLPLALQSGNVDSTWLAPISAFQLNIVAYAEGADATINSGGGYVSYNSPHALVAGDNWNGTCNASYGQSTSEASNCLYSVVADAQTTSVVQYFGVPQA